MSHTIEKAFVHSFETRFVERPSDGSSREVAEIRCMIDRSYRSGEKYVRDKNFWVTVELWGGRVGHLHGIIRKGAAILVTGRYFVQSWKDDKGGEREKVILRANEVALLPFCLDSVEYKPKGDGGQEVAEEHEEEYEPF